MSINSDRERRIDRNDQGQDEGSHHDFRRCLKQRNNDAVHSPIDFTCRVQK